MSAPKTCERKVGAVTPRACGAPAEYRITWRLVPGTPSEHLCGEHAREADDLGALARAVRL